MNNSCSQSKAREGGFLILILIALLIGFIWLLSIFSSWANGWEQYDAPYMQAAWFYRMVIFWVLEGFWSILKLPWAIPIDSTGWYIVSALALQVLALVLVVFLVIPWGIIVINFGFLPAIYLAGYRFGVFFQSLF